MESYFRTFQLQFNPPILLLFYKKFENVYYNTLEFLNQNFCGAITFDRITFLEVYCQIVLQAIYILYRDDVEFKY